MAHWALQVLLGFGDWDKANQGTQTHTEALNVLSSPSISLGYQAKDLVPIVGRSDLGPTASSDRADSVRRCTVHCRKL